MVTDFFQKNESYTEFTLFNISPKYRICAVIKKSTIFNLLFKIIFNLYFMIKLNHKFY